ncbi:MAG TPA: MBL fold metallo-hydrolase [Ktedonobacteraceae bacterium]|nr:MBL fold metallo-hydrolase [Ktedonobacteraceae bacterium]
MTKVKQLRAGLWQISLPFQDEEEIIGSYLLAGNDEVLLIDPGPASTLEALFDGLRTAGFDPQDITHILLTHIHLDHAGATGSLARRVSKAQVYAHQLGTPHLSDPSKLIASAQRIYGERMQPLWGTIEAVPQDQLHALEGNEILNVAGRRLEIHYAPGHAIHHIICFDAHSGELFAGDVAGVRLPGIDYVRPPTPPPDLDLEAWSASLDLLKRLRPDVLYLGHYGAVTNIMTHISSLRERLYGWGDFVLHLMNEGKTEEEIAAQLIKQSNPELERVTRSFRDVVRYDIATNYPMTVQGYMRYWRKKHPERLKASNQ